MVAAALASACAAAAVAAASAAAADQRLPCCCLCVRDRAQHVVAMLTAYNEHVILLAQTIMCVTVVLSCEMLCYAVVSCAAHMCCDKLSCAHVLWYNALRGGVPAGTKCHVWVFAMVHGLQVPCISFAIMMSTHGMFTPIRQVVMHPVARH